MKDSGEGRTTTFVNTPNGIFTDQGTWFRTTEELLTDYAGDLFEHESVQELISSTDSWLSLPVNAALWFVPCALWFFDISIAVVLTFILYFFLRITGPFFTSHNLQIIPKILDQIMLQLIVYFIFLTYFLQSGYYTTAAIGFGLFVLLRWGVIKKLTDPIILQVNDKVYAIPYEDKMLRSMVVKKSMKYRTSLPEVDEIEKSILRAIRKD